MSTSPADRAAAGAGPAEVSAGLPPTAPSVWSPADNPISAAWRRGWLSCLYAHGITPSPELLAAT